MFDNLLVGGLDLARRAFVALVIILITIALARRLKHRVLRTGTHAVEDKVVATLVANLAYVGAIVIGVVTALSMLGTDVNALITALGVTGLAFSLALQDVLRNFVAGLYILLEKPFNIGDRVALRDVDGVLESIDLRTTYLRTTSASQVIVPNSALMTDIVTNRSLGRLQAYSISVSGGPEIAGEALTRYTAVLDGKRGVSTQPEPEVVVESLDVDQTTIRLRFWAEKQSTVVGEVARELRSQLPEATVSAKADDS
ncbi:MAG TPA: mechanosensitive ion channel family protein [Thermomicrobiales bacterium]|nr:mechanosensitive ion channel family protein [Thermomicrobiales bacterium]